MAHDHTDAAVVRDRPTSGKRTRFPSGTLPPTPSRSTAVMRLTAELVTGYGHRLAFAPDGEHWVAASIGGAQIWRGTTSIGTLMGGSTATDRVRFSRDSKRLLLAPYAYDLTRAEWLEARPLAQRLAGAGQLPLDVALRGAAWSPDGDELVVAAALGTPYHRALGLVRPQVVRVRSADGEPAAPELATLCDDGRERRAVAINDRFIAIAARDIEIWSRADQRMIATLSGHAVRVTELAFRGDDGAQLASVDGRGELRLWNTTDWTQRARIQASRNNLLAVAIHPTRKIIATGGCDGMIRMWSIADGAGEAEPAVPLAHYALGGWVQGLAFSPNGTCLLAAANGLPTRVAMFAL